MEGGREKRCHVEGSWQMAGHSVNIQYILVSSHLPSAISEWVKPSDKLIYKLVIGMLAIDFYRLNITSVNGLWIPVKSGVY